MSKKSTEIGVGKKVLASALSAAMVVAFAPAVAMADGTESGDTQATASQPSNDAQTTANEAAKSLPDAVNDTITISESGTYQLAADVTADVVVNGSIDVVLDLNNHKLTNKSSDTIKIGKEAKLTVIGKGTVDNVTHRKAAIYNCGSCDLQAGTYERSAEAGNSSGNGGNSYYTVLNHGEMTVADGVVVNNKGSYSSLFENGYFTYSDNNDGSNDPSLTINGGVFDGGLNTVKNDDGATITVKGGYFKNYTQAAFQNHHIARIEGGSFEAEDCAAVLQCGVCNATAEHDAHQLTISGGSFKGKITSNVGTVSISGGTFTDIANAVKYAADTATLTMGADATASLTIPAGKDITLDLNGKKLTNVAGQHTITNNGTLTIKGEGTVDNVSHGKAAVYNATTGAVTLEGGTYNRSKENGNSKSDNGGNSFYTLKNFGQMTIKDGVVVKQGENEAGGQYSSMVANGWQNASTAGNSRQEPALRDGGAVLTIDGGTFSGGLNTVKNDDNGVLTINGGTFKNYSQMAFQNHNVATVTGGTFEGASGASAIENCGTGCGPVSGTPYDKHKLTISGGVFNGKLVNNVEGGSVGISGGTFSVDPAAYLADGSVVYKKHSGSDYSYIVQASGAAQPANSSGYNYWTSSDGKTYTEGYSAPVTPVDPTPTPTPTPEPAAPGTNVSGTDSAGNTVEATVTDNNKTTLPDGTEAAGSVEYKGTASSGSEPASSADIPASVTSSDGTVYAVTKIADDAFNGQGQLKSVSIPATVVEIGARAFAGTGIESVKLPAATSTLGAGAFKGCASLKTADISSAALTQIPADAFNGAAITSIDIPGSVKSVGARAFKGTALKSVELPKAVVSIAKSTFQDCDALKSASSSAKTIGRSAFADCGSLKTVSLSKATEVGAYALSGTALKSVSLPKAESIGAGAFKDAAKLKALATGSVLEELGPKALDGTKIKTLTIRSKRLTKSGVKGSLKGSAVTRVEVAVSGSKKTQDKYVKRYSKFFAKANSGKSVEVTKAKKASKK